MHDQPRYEPLEASDFFLSGQSAQSAVAGTIPRGHLETDSHLFTGKVDGALVTTLPFDITEQALERGRERYDIHCSACHDRIGEGRGMVVERGFKQPPSFHIVRLREAPIGHFFDVQTRGYGAMARAAQRVSVEDRWRIAAYIRALQLSQSATVSALSPIDREALARVE